MKKKLPTPKRRAARTSRSRPDRLTNAELIEFDVPRIEEWQRFAATFDGYEAMGSFDACADLANRGQPRTLTELRACLFFEARRERFGFLPDARALKKIARLLSRIRTKIRRRELD